VTSSGTAAHIALVILNYIMHGVGIFIAYMSSKLKEKKRQYCQCGKGPLTLNKFGDLFKKKKKTPSYLISNAKLTSIEEEEHKSNLRGDQCGGGVWETLAC